MTRKIERQMNDAILHSQDWKNDNTQVIYSPDRDASYVFLHGNHIATILETSIELYNCGWFTSTTKARLNAILKEHGNGAYIYQKNRQWFVNDNGATIPFSEGMVLV